MSASRSVNICIIFGRIICVDYIAVIVQESSECVMYAGDFAALVNKVERYSAGHVMSWAKRRPACDEHGVIAV